MYIALSSILSACSRLVCVGFLVTAGMTIPEIWKLTESTFTKSSDGSTVFIPLEMCNPLYVSVDGNAIIFDGPEVGVCHSPKYMIGSSAAALVFAGAAMMLFFFFEFLGNCGCKQISRSSLFGMSLFLSFSLIQGAASCYSLWTECGKREEYFLAMFRKAGDTTITNVQMQGSRIWFFVTMVTALSAAAVLIMESLLLLCCAKTTEKTETEPSQIAPPKTTTSTATAATPSSDEQSQAGVSTSAETSKMSNRSSTLPPWAQP